MNTEKRRKETPKHKGVQSLDVAWRYWCRKHADELPLPIQSMRKTRKGIVLVFAGAHPRLKFTANDESVKAIIDGWKILFHFGVFSLRSEGGRWHCTCCDPDERRTFDTRYGLWESHVFKPWLEEIRKLLRPGMWILMGEDPFQADLVGGAFRTSRWRRTMGVEQWREAVPQSEAFKRLAFHRGVTDGFRAIPDPQFHSAHLPT